MKVAHAVGWYLPESVGGSEVYVRELCRELRSLGVDCVVLAPRDDGGEERYRIDDTEVWRYPVLNATTGRGRPARHGGFERFAALLEECGAEVLHLHSMTYGCGVEHLRHARERGLKTVTTVHLPGVACLRGTMMRLGREACDGVIDELRCGECWLEWRGAPYPIAHAAVATLHAGGRIASGLAARLPGRIGTAADVLGHVTRKRSELAALAEASQRVVAVCEWLREALRANGVADEKLVLCRQGVAAVDRARFGSVAPEDSPLRVGYFGRADVIKGVDVLVRAIVAQPALAIELRLYTLAKSDAERMELERLQSLARGDARIAFVPPVPSEQVREAMRAFHVIAVPSRCPETGPLVAMEALAAGVPVLGSALGGLLELIEDGVTGWLLPHDDVSAWSTKLAELSRDRAAVAAFAPERVATLSTTADVARRMLALYEALPDLARGELLP